MALRGWSWDAALGPAGLGDRPLLEALATAIPDEAIEGSGARQQRRRRLPTHLVVTLVVAMGLWASESLRHVLAEVVAGWRERALRRTKQNVVLQPTEVLADGSLLAAIDPTPRARRRGEHGIVLRLIEYALDSPAGPGRAKYRLITSLLDDRACPAAQLAATYHERWEIETTLDEVKVHQWAHPRPLRSKHPREVVQEVYGLLLAHLALRTLLHQAALHEGLDPDRLSFTGALRVLRRAIPRAQRTQPTHLPLVARTC